MEQAVTYHAMMVAGQVEVDTITYNSLITACGNMKSERWMNEAVKYHGMMVADKVEVDTITYNSLITACGKVKNNATAAKKGCEYFFEMLKSNVQVNAFGLQGVLSCCSGLDSDEKREVMEAVLRYPHLAVTKSQLDKFPGIQKMVLSHFGARDGQEYYKRLESAERQSGHSGGGKGNTGNRSRVMHR